MPLTTVVLPNNAGTSLYDKFPPLAPIVKTCEDVFVVGYAGMVLPLIFSTLLIDIFIQLIINFLSIQKQVVLQMNI